MMGDKELLKGRDGFEDRGWRRKTRHDGDDGLDTGEARLFTWLARYFSLELGR